MRQQLRQFDVSHRSPRGGFTLVELLVVVGVILLLTVMTIGAINLSVTSERVRSGARQVQSLIEGARDRAIYAKEPRGVRLLVNDQIVENFDHDNNGGTAPIPLRALVTSLVYIGTAGQDTSAEDRDDVDGDGLVSELFTYVQVLDPSHGSAPSPGTPASRAIIGTNTDWTGLYERGLIGPNSTIVIDGCQYKIDPRSFPISRELKPHNATPGPGESYGGLNGNVNGNNPYRPNPSPPPDFGTPTNDEVLYLLWTDSCLPTPAPAVLGPWDTEPLPFSIQLEPDVLPGEEASILPQNVCIDLQSSHLPDAWVTDLIGGGQQYSNRMDLMFAPGGGLIGDAGAAGVIHLHLCDIGDAIANTLPGSPTKTDGTPREGDEFGITIFTRAGRVIVHPMDLASSAYPANWMANNSYAANDVVSPTLYNGLIYRARNAASSGGSEPQWNTAPGGTTQDGGIQWIGVKHDVWDFGEEGEVAK